MSTVLTSTSIRLEIQKIKELPVAINNDDTSIDEIAKVIQSDPILTSRILGLANSAFFGFSHSLYNLTEAIVHVLVREADEALYHCKNNDCDKITFYRDLQIKS